MDTQSSEISTESIMHQEATILSLMANNINWEVNPQFQDSYRKVVTPVPSPEGESKNSIVLGNPDLTLPSTTADNPYFQFLVMKKYQRLHEHSKQTLANFDAHEAVGALKDPLHTPKGSTLHNQSLKETENNFITAFRDARREFSLLESVSKNGLMQIWSREALDAYSSWLLAVAQTNDSPIAGLGIMFIDADNFGQLNKDESHVFGDKVLKIIAKKMRDNTDFPFRYGGEEIAILIPIFKKLGNNNRQEITEEDVESPKFQENFYQRMVDVYQTNLTNILIPGSEKHSSITTSAGLKLYSLKELRAMDHPEKIFTEPQEFQKISKKAGKNCITIPPQNTT